MNILLLGSGTQALAILESIAKHNNIIMLLNETGNYADVSKYVNERIVTTFRVTSVNYLLLVKKILLEKKVEVVIPMGDMQAEFLSINRDELLKLTHYKLPSYNDFIRGYDKNQLMSLCAIKGYPHPFTIDLSQISYKESHSFETFPYPGILKPNCTTGGRGMCIINNYDDLVRVYPEIKLAYGECHLQQFIKEGGRQLKIQLYVNEKCELLYSSVMEKVRWYPIKGGSSCCSVTIKNPQIVEVCYKILKDIQWLGFADFDAIENPETGEILIMEINPRLPACIGAAIKAGIDWGRIIVDEAIGNPPQTYSFKEGIVFRHLGFDILWFLKSPVRFKAKPNWFRFWGSKVYYQDFIFFDQKPFWIGTHHNIKKLFNPDFKKAKSGTR